MKGWSDRAQFQPQKVRQSTGSCLPSLSDDDYLSLLRPYADGRFGSDETKTRHFYDLALARKHNLRTDFEGFYADVLSKPGFRFEEAAEVPKGRIGKAEEQIIEEARVLGWQGKALPIDEDDIEDQNALIFTETAGGETRTVIKMKVRPEAQTKIMPKLRRADRQTNAPKAGEPLAEDDFSADILSAVKTVNHHAGDGAYNQSTLEKARKHLSALRDLAKSADPEVAGMAKEYIGWIEKVDQSTRDRQAIPEKFEAYLRKTAPPRQRRQQTDFTVRKTKVLLTKRKIEKGELLVESESADMTTMFRGNNMPEGEQYEVDFGDGIIARYRPWGTKNMYASSGELEIVVPERPDAKSLDRALEHVGKLGVKTNVASAEDAEMLYLHKQAYIAKADREPEYKQMIADLDGRNASKTERVQAMRAFWEKRLGIRDITKTPGYDPVGEYQLGFRDQKLSGGYRQQYRFDISDADLDREMKGYTLYHSLTNGNSMSNFLDTALGNNGAMISTVEKIRSGIAPGGMSPEADMRSGGASYIFTRIRKGPTSGGDRSAGLYLKKRLLRRMDAISYDHDAYGKVKDDYVTEHRGFNPASWKEFSRRSGNETILKHSVMLLDNIEHVVVGSDSERRAVLDVFRKHGISVLPDGRKIEEVVLSR